MVEVTCIVNVHRESHLVTPTIRSVQRARDFADKCGLTTNLLVVMDNPDDDTISVINQLVPDTSQILQVDVCDLALARNEGVRASDSDYICFLDGDDLWCKTWIINSYTKALQMDEECVFHPQYNIYFGNDAEHIFKHVDSESERFVIDYLYRMNYWTALSFANKSVYEKHPYRRNTITDGFGYEDWNWNHETLTAGIKHKVVCNTAHYIRRGKDEKSLLDKTNSAGAIPRILDVYRNNDEDQHVSKVA